MNVAELLVPLPIGSTFPADFEIVVVDDVVSR